MGAMSPIGATPDWVVTGVINLQLFRARIGFRRYVAMCIYFYLLVSVVATNLRGELRMAQNRTLETGSARQFRASRNRRETLIYDGV